MKNNRVVHCKKEPYDVYIGRPFKMLNVLYCGLLYNYAKKEEGYSYEHWNIEYGLKDCANKGLFNLHCLYPDNSENLESAAFEYIISENIDCVLHVSFNDQYDFPESAAKMALRMDIPVIQFDPDASWRFNNWILPRKNRVSHFITTHSATLPQYKQHGLKVIKSQWGGSPFYKYDPYADKIYDVSFIGQKHGQRPDGEFVRGEIIKELNGAGIKVDLFGNYWDGFSNWHGYVTNEHRVVDVFNQSKICLNLSNSWYYNSVSQVKGRNFQIPQTGQFQLTTPADNIENYFLPDKEIVIASSIDDMINKINYYLIKGNEREKIALNSYKRMLASHQWHHRFQDIFTEVGLL